MMRKQLYRAAVVLALAAAAVTGVTAPSADAAAAHHTHAQISRHAAQTNRDWWW